MFEDPLPPDGRPPKRRRYLAIAFAATLVLVLAGAVTAGVLLGNRGSEPKAQSASPTDQPRRPSSGPPSRVPGWAVAYNSRSRIAYDVPADWRVFPPEETFDVPALGDVAFRGLANGPGYTCDGRDRVIGTVGSTAVKPTKTLETTAVEFARTMGRTLYEQARPQVRVKQPRAVTVDGVDAVRTEATVTMPSGKPCAPTESKLGVIALRGENSYVVVVAAGEKARPAARPSAEGATAVSRVIDTVRPVR